MDACLSRDPCYDATDESPHLSHVRREAIVNFGGSQMITSGCLDLIGIMIRTDLMGTCGRSPRDRSFMLTKAESDWIG